MVVKIKMMVMDLFMMIKVVVVVVVVVVVMIMIIITMNDDTTVITIYITSYHSVWKQSKVLINPILTRKFLTKSSTTSGLRTIDGLMIESLWT